MIGTPTRTTIAPELPSATAAEVVATAMHALASTTSLEVTLVVSRRGDLG